MRCNSRLIVFLIAVLINLTQFVSAGDEIDTISSLHKMEDCLVEGDLDNVGVAGNIFYTTVSDSALWALGEDLQPHQVLPEMGFLPFGMANTDRSLFAVDDSDAPYLHVIDADGNLVHSFVWEEGWTGFYGWVHQDRLYIEHQSHQVSENGIVLLSLDGSSESYLDFPAALMSDISFPHFSTTGFYVSPTGQQIVYDAAYDTEEYPYHTRGLILAEVDTKAELWRTDTNHIWDRMWSRPEWSPDGTQFAYVRQDYEHADLEIALVDQTGIESILTNINEEDTFLVPMSLSWSPDGSKIAFWLWDASWTLREPYTRPQQSPPLPLYLADLTTNTVYDLCLQGRDQKIIWSPDGFSLIFNSDGCIKFVDLRDRLYVDIPLTPKVGSSLAWLNS
jgi:hypothetical protein